MSFTFALVGVCSCEHKTLNGLLYLLPVRSHRGTLHEFHDLISVMAEFASVALIAAADRARLLESHAQSHNKNLPHEPRRGF